MASVWTIPCSLIIIVCLVPCVTGECLHLADYDRGKRLTPNSVFATIYQQSFHQCRRQCAFRTSCLVFTYTSSNGICELGSHGYGMESVNDDDVLSSPTTWTPGNVNGQCSGHVCPEWMMCVGLTSGSNICIQPDSDIVPATTTTTPPTTTTTPSTTTTTPPTTTTTPPTTTTTPPTTTSIPSTTTTTPLTTTTAPPVTTTTPPTTTTTTTPSVTTTTPPTTTTTPPTTTTAPPVTTTTPPTTTTAPPVTTTTPPTTTTAPPTTTTTPPTTTTAPPVTTTTPSTTTTTPPTTTTAPPVTTTTPSTTTTTPPTTPPTTTTTPPTTTTTPPTTTTTPPTTTLIPSTTTTTPSTTTTTPPTTTTAPPVTTTTPPTTTTTPSVTTTTPPTTTTTPSGTTTTLSTTTTTPPTTTTAPSVTTTTPSTTTTTPPTTTTAPPVTTTTSPATTTTPPTTTTAPPTTITAPLVTTTTPSTTTTTPLTTTTIPSTTTITPTTIQNTTTEPSTATTTILTTPTTTTLPTTEAIFNISSYQVLNVFGDFASAVSACAAVGGIIPDFKVQSEIDGILPLLQNTTVLCNGCPIDGMIYENSSVIITSPNYPQDYGCFVECTCPLKAESSDLKLQLNLFVNNLENNCDYLVIYDGPNTTSPGLGKFYGLNLNHILVSSTDEVLLRFTTDLSVTRPGFTLTVSTVGASVNSSGHTTLSNVRALSKQFWIGGSMSGATQSWIFADGSEMPSSMVPYMDYGWDYYNSYDYYYENLPLVDFRRAIKSTGAFQALHEDWQSYTLCGLP